VVGEVDQPLDLDLDAGPVEPGLREELAQFGDGRRITTVERAEGLG
jgi:hypothetical protein